MGQMQNKFPIKISTEHIGNQIWITFRYNLKVRLPTQKESEHKNKVNQAIKATESEIEFSRKKPN